MIAIPYHKYTGDQKCLDAIVRNVNLIISLFEQSGIRYRLPTGADLSHRLDAGKWTYKSVETTSREFPFEQPPGSIEGTFVFQRRSVRAELLPMGSLLLRKVLFEQDK